MAINKKLVHFKTFAKFQEALDANNILDTSIVFILNTQLIYTHKKLYDCKPEVLASLTNDGLLSKEDYKKLNDLPNNAELITALGNKVDKIAGKGLSTNDYTTAEKNKLDKLQGSIVSMTQALYDALSTKDSETLYIVD